MKHDSEQRVTIEDLLRLKKAERPPAEFWAAFESELRAKQLAAIVARRPWWVGLSTVFAVARRHSVSLGAVAAIALAWVGVRQVGFAPQSRQVVTVARAQPAAAPSSSVAAVKASEAARTQETAVERPVATAPIRTPAPGVVAEERVSHVMPAPESRPPVASSREPFGDGIAVTLADFHVSAPDLGQRDVFGSDREFESSVASSRQQNSEPLSRMDPSAERRARLMAPALPTYASSSPSSLSRDWMRERSSDDRRYESMDLNGSSDRAVVGFRF
ncbi:MAG TPA: hypothetical protein VII43_07495 [Opitutaceae bacterium]